MCPYFIIAGATEDSAAIGLHEVARPLTALTLLTPFSV
jgi:hypothetical protein